LRSSILAQIRSVVVASTAITLVLLFFSPQPQARAQEIPSGVTYIRAPDAVNAAAKTKLEKAFADGARFPSELLEGHIVICGPMLWKALKPNADKTMRDALLIVGNIPTSQGVIVSEGRGFRNKQQLLSFWKALMTNYPALQHGKVRQASATEIRYYWKTTAFDIDEPFFAVEAGSQTFVIHLGVKLPMYTFDLVGSLMDLRGTEPEGFPHPN